MAGFPLGILTEFGVGTDVQIVYIVVMISAVHSSLILIFENRYYIMFAKETKWKHYRKLFSAGNYIFAFTYFIPALFNVPDQEVAVRHLYEIIPDLSPTISDSQIFVVATEFTLVVVPISIFVVVNAIECYLCEHFEATEKFPPFYVHPSELYSEKG
uniref:G protein-coupled receptor n=1 Tax=Caenorhabditis tropicalis TaxID=1561998 RepID=A0A1I7TXS4_9PELO